jgi:hypothetical protein
MSGAGSIRRARFVVAALAMGMVVVGCGDDDDAPKEQSPGTTAPFVGTGVPPESTGGTGGTLVNNQPTSPAVNNAPPGSSGTG